MFIKLSKISLLLISILLTSCSSYLSIDKKIDIINENYVQTIQTNAKISYFYDDIESLVDKSEIIIEGEVMDTSYFDYNTVTYTKCHIKVSKSFNSNSKAGDILTINDLGGITTKAALMEYFNYTDKTGMSPTNKDESTNIRILSMGADYMKQNDKVLIFGVRGHLISGEVYYVPLGACQGKFNISDNKAERFAPDDSNKKYKSLNKDITQMEKDINDILNKSE